MAFIRYSRYAWSGLYRICNSILHWVDMIRWLSSIQGIPSLFTGIDPGQVYLHYGNPEHKLRFRHADFRPGARSDTRIVAI